jgi:hypothetical protein
MPVLAALDECFTTLTQISVYADLGLEDSTMQQHALLLIQQCCSEIDMTIQGILQVLDD